MGVASLSVDIEDDVEHPEWDGFVQQNPWGDVVQSTPWARFRQAAGFKSHRIVARERGTIVGGTQAFARRVGPWRLVYVPYGPLLAPDAPKDLATDIVGTLRRVALSGGALFVQPPLHGEAIAAELTGSGFAPCDVKVAPSATLRLDVSRPVEELRRGLSHKMRAQVSRWEAAGVRVRQGTREDLSLLADLHARSAEYQGFTPMTQTYLERLWDALSPGGHTRLFIGSVGEELVAADLFTSFGGVLSERIKGFDRNDEYAKARVPAALVWAAVVDAHERGERWLDLGGIGRAAAIALLEGGPTATDLKTKHRFKLSFGVHPVLYPMAVELVRGPVVRAGLTIARSAGPGRRWIRRMAGRMRSGTPA